MCQAMSSLNYVCCCMFSVSLLSLIAMETINSHRFFKRQTKHIHKFFFKRKLHSKKHSIRFLSVASLNVNKILNHIQVFFIFQTICIFSSSMMKKMLHTNHRKKFTNTVWLPEAYVQNTIELLLFFLPFLDFICH